MLQKEIAARIGCTQSFVSQVRRDNIASGKIVPPSERVDSLGRKRPTSYQHTPKDSAQEPAAEALSYRGGKCLATMAILDLEEIRPDDAERKQAFALVMDWIEKRKQSWQS